MNREATSKYEIRPYSLMTRDGWAVYSNGQYIRVFTWVWQARRLVRTLQKLDKAAN